MASSPITSWQINRTKVETRTNFIFLDSKITVDGDFSHKIKRCFLLERKAMTNLGSILRCRDITDMGSISESGRPPREGNGNPLQYSCLGNLLDRGPWWATVHGDRKSTLHYSVSMKSSDRETKSADGNQRWGRAW